MSFKSYLSKRKSGGRNWWKPKEIGETILVQLVQTVEEDTPNSKYHATQVVHEFIKIDEEGEPVGTVWANAIPLLQWKLERLHSQGVPEEDLAGIIWRIQYQGKEVVSAPDEKPERSAHAYEVEGMAQIPGSDEWGSWFNVGGGVHELLSEEAQKSFWEERKANKDDEAEAPKPKKKGGKTPRQGYRMVGLRPQVKQKLDATLEYLSETLGRPVAASEAINDALDTYRAELLIEEEEE